MTKPKEEVTVKLSYKINKKKAKTKLGQKTILQMFLAADTASVRLASIATAKKTDLKQANKLFGEALTQCLLVLDLAMDLGVVSGTTSDGRRFDVKEKKKLKKTN